MRVDLRSWLSAIRSSFWLLPMVISGVAIAAALFVMEADLAVQSAGIRFVSTMTMPIESARLALSTIAGSMITIASLVFSMTLVALTLVSQQLGPRILLLFMNDRITQVMLGLFIGTFIFALIVLLQVGDEELVGRVPAMAVIGTAVLAIFSLGMMIQFIHHIATRIQADVLIAELGGELNEAAGTFVDLERDCDDIVSQEELKAAGKHFSGNGVTDLLLPTSGYLRRLDVGTACQLAADRDLVLKMTGRPGQFILAGTPILSVAGIGHDDKLSEELTADLCGLVVIGNRRTPEASIDFQLSALVEVALRALSPGINDPFTAIACIDRLADGIRTLMKRKVEQRGSRDDDGTIRIVHAEEPFRRYLKSAFAAIAEAGRGNARIEHRLIEVCTNLEELADDARHKSELKSFRTTIEAEQDR